MNKHDTDDPVINSQEGGEEEEAGIDLGNLTSMKFWKCKNALKRGRPGFELLFKSSLRGFTPIKDLDQQ